MPLYQNLVETMREGVVILSQDHTILYANKAFCKLVKSTENKITGASVLEYIQTPVKREFETLLNREYKKKKGETTLKTTRNTSVPVSVCINIHESDSSTGYCVTFTDPATNKLTMKKRDEFIDIASHELKTPLTNIVAYTQLLNKYFLTHGDAKANDYIMRMSRQLNRLTVLVSNLLDVSVVEAGKLKLNLNMINADELLQEIMDDARVTYLTNTIQLNGKTGAVIKGDWDRLSQVIGHLINNAIKYSPQNATITLKSEIAKNRLIIKVRDAGIGIPPQQRTRIFNRFHRVGGHKRESYPGLGLGLYMSAEIIRRHRGTIWVTSTEGKGSTFHISLPTRQTDTT
jgi:PAS domain S-box-containing protein